jgi:hypothetical protein
MQSIIIVIRQILLVAGGGLITRGEFTQGEWETLVGATVIVATAIWRYIEKSKEKKELAAAKAAPAELPK